MFKFMFQTAQLLIGMAILGVAAWFGVEYLVYGLRWAAIYSAIYPDYFQYGGTLLTFAALLNLVAQKSKI